MGTNFTHRVYDLIEIYELVLRKLGPICMKGGGSEYWCQLILSHAQCQLEFMYESVKCVDQNFNLPPCC